MWTSVDPIEIDDVDPGWDLLPERLEEHPPGPELAGWLASIDVTRLSGYDRVVVLQAHQRQVSHHQAQAYAAMAAIGDHFQATDEDREMAWDSAVAEIRAGLRLTRRAAESELGFACELRERLPRLGQLLEAGEMDRRRAWVIASGTCHLPAEAARQVVDAIAPRATELTTGQLRARLRSLCIEADPAEAARRYEQALADRRVVSEPTEAGTAQLFGLDLPPSRVAAVTRRINRIARSLRTRGEARTMDQLRADVFLDLLQGTGGSAGIRQDGGMVDITVDLETLAGLADRPGELGGYGPVISDIARRVAGDQPAAVWQYTVTDRYGRPIHVGTTRRRPTAGQRRAVRARHRTCVFPGCRMPATECDLDHRIPWTESGRTEAWNLAPACRHDHKIRHYGWTYRILPNGDVEWTSRLGHRYLVRCRSP